MTTWWRANRFELAIHLTKLSDGFPISKARVSYTLTNAGKQVTTSVDSPAEPGIFLAVLRAPAAGQYTGLVTVESAELPDGPIEFALPSIKVYADDSSAHAASHAQSAPTDEITYLKPQQWRFGLQTIVGSADALHPRVEGARQSRRSPSVGSTRSTAGSRTCPSATRRQVCPRGGSSEEGSNPGCHRAVDCWSGSGSNDGEPGHS